MLGLGTGGPKEWAGTPLASWGAQEASGVCVRAGRPSSLVEDLLEVPKGIFVDPTGWNFTKIQAFHLSIDVRNDLWESWVEMSKQM